MFSRNEHLLSSPLGRQSCLRSHFLKAHGAPIFPKLTVFNDRGVWRKRALPIQKEPLIRIRQGLRIAVLSFCSTDIAQRVQLLNCGIDFVLVPPAVPYFSSSLTIDHLIINKSYKSYWHRKFEKVKSVKRQMRWMLEAL